MTKDKKVRIYKNPDRTKVEAPQPYVPQYQLYGYEPEEMKSGNVPSSVQKMKPILSHDNPRVRKTGLRQEYTTSTVSPIGRGRGPVPNVGNNMEHTWSSVDGDLIDDFDQEIDPSHPMIDNNEYVTETALGGAAQSSLKYETEEYENEVEIEVQPTKSFLTEEQLHHLVEEEEEYISDEGGVDQLPELLQKLDAGDYALFVDGAAMATGSLDFVQEQASLFIFGEHELCDGNPVPVEDLVIVKKLNLKVGLFAQ